MRPAPGRTWPNHLDLPQGFNDPCQDGVRGVPWFWPGSIAKCRGTNAATGTIRSLAEWPDVIRFRKPNDE